MKTKQWREFTDDELREKMQDKIALLFKRRFETHDDQAKNPGEIREAGKDIARIRTILREREMGLARGGMTGGKRLSVDTRHEGEKEAPTETQAPVGEAEE